ncbi:GOLPH3/VPS74 family protein [Arthrobacter nitrophenolicus]|uniref:GPP34 family phosphoprotein n=1 Tax=Arthrobacter nitrophenolicus TaxID=683150 RepID=A0A4R5Y3A5_9MICC|nr:GPP34 family phosphoprotein [Arthrobacter nitrophenolicus]TDL38893.1 GPP34 family phosphoprotein [Arthrobacter nitrophenolicus]
MDAQTPPTVELNLPQAFLLLATNDQDGKLELPVFALRTTLAGAILAELDMIGAIHLEGKHVRATGTTPGTDFQHELDLIRHKSRPHTPKAWVSMLEGRAEVQRVYEGMVSRGIVEHVGEKHLGVFQTVRYPEKDHAPEAALVQKLEAALSDTSAPPQVPESAEAVSASQDAGAPGAAAAAGVPDAAAAKPAAKAHEPRILALIALLEAAGLLSRLFPAADRVWADELAKDYWPARAVEDELRMIRLAEEEAANL